MERVSNKGIVPLKIEKDNDKPPKGADWFAKHNPNILLLAKKESGKTTLEWNIINHCGGKLTKYIFIVSTVDKDPMWIKIVKTLEAKRPGSTACFTSIIDDDGVNIIEQFLKENGVEAHHEEDDIKFEPKSQVGSGRKLPIEIDYDSDGNEYIVNDPNGPNQIGEGSDKKIDDSKWTHNYPKFVIVLDDLGDEMRNRELGRLTRTNRHHKSMVICSAHGITDMLPKTIAQMDYILAFNRIPDTDLLDLYKKARLSIGYENFVDMYNKATAKPYNFLYIYRGGSKDEYRNGIEFKFT